MQKYLKNLSLYQHIDRKKFDALVKKWNMDKGVTKFKTWELTCALVKRSYGFYHDLCDQVLLDIYKHTFSRKIKKAVREILAIDSSEIQVHGSLFSIPFWKKKFCSGNQAAAKLHVVWNVCGEWVEDFLITPGRKNDSPVASLLKLLSGKTYVFDRAYNDLSFWYKITCAGSHFVTRLKKCSPQ